MIHILQDSEIDVKQIPLCISQRAFSTFFQRTGSNSQRYWPIDKGAEFFEIMPSTVHSNLTIESKNPLHNKICQS